MNGRLVIFLFIAAMIGTTVYAQTPTNRFGYDEGDTPQYGAGGLGNTSEPPQVAPSGDEAPPVLPSSLTTPKLPDGILNTNQPVPEYGGDPTKVGAKELSSMEKDVLGNTDCDDHARKAENACTTSKTKTGLWAGLKQAAVGALFGAGTSAAERCKAQFLNSQQAAQGVAEITNNCYKESGACTDSCHRIHEYSIRQAEQYDRLYSNCPPTNYALCSVYRQRAQQFNIKAEDSDRNEQQCKYASGKAKDMGTVAGFGIGQMAANAAFCRQELTKDLGHDPCQDPMWKNTGVCAGATSLTGNCSDPASAANNPFCQNPGGTGGNSVTMGGDGGFTPPNIDPGGATSDESAGGGFMGNPDSKGTASKFDSNDGANGGGGLGGMGAYPGGAGNQQANGQGGPGYKDPGGGVGGGSGYSVSGVPVGDGGGMYGRQGRGGGDDKLDLNKYLPGGEKDPRKPANANELMAKGITGPNDLTNFEKVTRMMNKKRPFLKP